MLASQQFNALVHMILFARFRLFSLWFKLSFEVINDIDKIIAQIDINGVEVSRIVSKILQENYIKIKELDKCVKSQTGVPNSKDPFFAAIIRKNCRNLKHKFVFQIWGKNYFP